MPIGKQCDDTILVEFIMKNLNIDTVCVHSFAHVTLTNLFHHVTYETLKAGFAVVKDFSGWNVRFWRNRKVGYLMKIVNYVAELKLNIHVECRPNEAICRISSKLLAYSFSKGSTG